MVNEKKGEEDILNQLQVLSDQSRDLKKEL